MIAGRCLCGAVAWRLDGAIDHINFCHCSMCRRVHGAPFGAFAHARSRDFRWLKGDASIARYESSPGIFRCFCPTCGSAVPVVEDDTVTLPAGGIEGDPGVRPSVHIFTGDKAAWYEIADALPQYRAFPPDAVW